MTTFQLVALPVLLIFIVITAVAVARHRVTPRLGLAWMILWLAAAIAIAFPDVLVWLAQALGIGRGADLVLYVSILGAFAAFFFTYLRFRRIEEQLTEIVRQIAIRDAEEQAGEDKKAS